MKEREVRLARRPERRAGPGDFSVHEAPVQEPLGVIANVLEGVTLRLLLKTSKPVTT